MQFNFLMAEGSRPRATAAILRNNGTEILMVQHRRKDDSTYWQLPGGGLNLGERTEEGVLRELWEETGLQGSVVRWLFTIPYRYGSSSTFLVEVAADAVPKLGHDPEEAERGYRKLIDVAWRRVEDAQDSPEVAMLGIVLSYLPLITPTPPCKGVAYMDLLREVRDARDSLLARVQHVLQSDARVNRR